MAKIHFLLKTPTEQTSLILFVYRLSSKHKIVKSVKEKIPTSEWSLKEQRPKAIKNRRDLAELRYKLMMIEQHMTAFIRGLENNATKITPVMVVSEFDSIINKRSKQDDRVMDYALNVYCKNKRENNIIHIRAAMRVLDNFRAGLCFCDLTIDLLTSYLSYLIDSNYTKNSINNYMTALKTVVRDAVYVRGKIVNEGFMRMLLSSNYAKEKIKRVSLTIDELKKLYALWENGQYKSTMEKQVLESFIVMSFTGIRLSDAKTSDKLNFENGEYYVKQTAKTNQRVKIPLHAMVKAIINSNDGFKFPKISDTTYITILKTLAKRAGINAIVNYSITIGNNKTSYSKPKHELITTHTARRSFATNMHIAGIPPAVAMMFTGHKNIQQYMDYIMIYEDKAAEEYQNHPFFESSD